MIGPMSSSSASPTVVESPPAPALGTPSEPLPTGWARAGLLAVLVFSLVALTGAFVAQHWFGLAPCVLCLVQRAPYALTATLAAIGLLVPLGPRAPGRVLVACGLLFAVGAVVAGYHVGVQQHWWASIAGCGGAPVTGLDPTSLLNTPLVATPPCDRVDWRLAGLSLAAYNAMASSLIAVACWVAAVRAGRAAASSPRTT